MRKDKNRESDTRQSLEEPTQSTDDEPPSKRHKTKTIFSETIEESSATISSDKPELENYLCEPLIGFYS